MIVGRARTWRQAGGSSGRRRRIIRGLAAGVSIIALAAVLSACTATPKFFDATANSDGTITLTWADVSNDGPILDCPTFDGYAVYMSTTSGGEDTTGVPLDAIMKNSQLITPSHQDLNDSGFPTGGYSYKVRNLHPGTTYYFVVLTIGQLSDGSACIASPSPEKSATTAGQQLGTGAVQVTLTWSTTADLDLHVLEPNGTEIYYGNRTADGGTLDVDSNGGCSNTTTSPVENVFWANTPASGTYTAKVEYYEGCAGTGGTGPQNFTITVKINGSVVLQQNGTINNPGDELDYPYTV